MNKQLMRSDKLEQLLQELFKQFCFERSTILTQVKVSCIECKELCKAYRQWHDLLTESFAEMEL